MSHATMIIKEQYTSSADDLKSRNNFCYTYPLPRFSSKNNFLQVSKC